MNDLVKKDEGAVIAAPQDIEQGNMAQAMIQLASDPNMDVGKLQAIIDMQGQMEDREAKKAFNQALVEFKKNPPRIIKNMAVSFEAKGRTTSYKHATIDSVCRQLDGPLNDLDLSFRWRVESDATKTRVTAILSHVLGHSEESFMEAAPDTSGGKNGIQGQGSSVTYLKRYTLLAALGLAEQGEDDDGVTAYMKAKVSEDEIAAMQAIIDETGTEISRLCAAYKVGSLPELSVAQYSTAMAQLEAKKRVKK